MVYAFVQITITSPETFAEYAKAAGPAMAKYGATAQAMSTEPVRLEGDNPLPTRAVLLSFPDKDAALGWANDPDLQDTHALRRGSGTSDIVLLA